MKPAVAASRNPNVHSYFFLADYHAIGGDADALSRSTLEIAASWLAVGLDPNKVMLYRQSDIPEIPELTWILHSVTAKGLMNRAHAYKAAVAENEATPGRDPDQAITMTLYSYPILMAADILMFKAARCPSARIRSSTSRWRATSRSASTTISARRSCCPTPSSATTSRRCRGLDGRKMSKSYGNVIPLFAGEKELRKLVMKIKTNSLEPGQPKDPSDSALFESIARSRRDEETAAVASATPRASAGAT